jgi:hypothetical protein
LEQRGKVRVVTVRKGGVAESQITDVNLGQAHRLPLQTPTLGCFIFSLELTKSRKFAIEECI